MGCKKSQNKERTTHPWQWVSWFKQRNERWWKKCPWVALGTPKIASPSSSPCPPPKNTRKSKNYKFLIYSCCPVFWRLQALGKRWPGAGALLPGASRCWKSAGEALLLWPLAPPGAGEALGRRWLPDSWRLQALEKRWEGAGLSIFSFLTPFACLFLPCC